MESNNLLSVDAARRSSKNNAKQHNKHSNHSNHSKHDKHSKHSNSRAHRDHHAHGARSHTSKRLLLWGCLATVVVIIIVVVAVVVGTSGSSTAASTREGETNLQPTSSPTFYNSGSNGGTAPTQSNPTPTREPTQKPTNRPTAPTTPEPTTAHPTMVPTTPRPTLASNSARDPNPPKDKIATSGHDPFEGVEPYYNKNGITFNWTQENLQILEAETVLSSEVPLGGYIRGRVVRDGMPLVRYHPGDMPFILFCIHTSTTDHWASWMKELAPSRRQCESSFGTCKVEDAWAKFQKMSDSYLKKHSWSTISKEITGGRNLKWPIGDGSGQECQQIYYYIGNKTGGHYPHMLYTSIPKAFLDFNRMGPSKYLQVPGDLGKSLKTVSPLQWTSYYDMMNFMQEAKNVIARKYGGGWEMNMHTQIGSARAGCGVGMKSKHKTIWNNPGITLDKIGDTAGDGKKRSNRLYMYSYLKDKGFTPWESLFGPYSLGEAISSRGIGAAPSRAWQYSRSSTQKCFCGSTAMEGRFGSYAEADAKADNKAIEIMPVKNRPVEDWYVGNWNTAIVEQYSKFAKHNAASFNDMVEIFGETIIDISNEVYGANIPRITYDRPFKSLKTIYDISQPARMCNSGKAIKTYTNKANVIWNFKDCYKLCNEEPKCKYFVISTEAKSDPKRTCMLFATCTKTKVALLQTIYDLDAYNAAES